MDWIDDLNAAVGRDGQSEVARRLGCSPATIHQLRNRDYKTNTLSQWQERFKAEYGTDMVECPELGEIDRGTCKFHHARPFAATNPVRVRMYQACRFCPNNPNRHD